MSDTTPDYNKIDHENDTLNVIDAKEKAAKIAEVKRQLETMTDKSRFRFDADEENDSDE
jgi:hypothetical protein